MNIKQIIENINQKPEHIRVRYVWGSVIVSMIFIFIIFGASIKDTFNLSADSKRLPAQINAAKSSITEMLDKNNIDPKDLKDNYQSLLNDNLPEEETLKPTTQETPENTAETSTFNTRSEDSSTSPAETENTSNSSNSMNNQEKTSAPEKTINKTLPIAY